MELHLYVVRQSKLVAWLISLVIEDTGHALFILVQCTKHPLVNISLTNQLVTRLISPVDQVFTNMLFNQIGRLNN